MIIKQSEQTELYYPRQTGPDSQGWALHDRHGRERRMSVRSRGEAAPQMLLPSVQNSSCWSGRMTGGFCLSALGESTQVIRGNCRPMSPLAVQNVHLQAVSLHSLTHGRQPEKRRTENHCGNRCGHPEKHAVSKTEFLTLMTSFQQISLPARSSSTCPKLPASSPMKATAGCSSQSGTHARS